MARMVLRPALVADEATPEQVLQLVRLHAPEAELVDHEGERVVVRVPGGMTEEHRKAAEGDLSNAIGHTVTLEPGLG